MLINRKQLGIFTSALIIVADILLINCKPENSEAIRFNKKGAVSRVILTDNHTGITINRIGLDWYLNDEKVKSRRVESFLGVLSEIQIYCPAPNSKLSAYRDSLEHHGVKIQVIKKWHKNYNTTLVTVEGKNILQTTNDGNIYIVEARGFPELDLSPYYTFSTSWLENYLFTQPSESIQSLSIEYPDTNKNFTLQRDSANNLQLILNTKTLNFNAVEAKLYLGFYEAVHYTTDDQIQSKTGAPYFKMMLDYTDQNIYINAFQLKTETGIDKSYFVAKINNEQWVKLRYLDFDALLVTPEYFQQNTN